jgi:hypothetical protein
MTGEPVDDRVLRPDLSGHMACALLPNPTVAEIDQGACHVPRQQDGFIVP